MAKTGQDSYQRPLRLLIVEDNARDAELIVASLKRAGYSLSFEVVSTEDQFCRRILGEEFDVILSDHSLPSWTGTEALKALLETGKPIPFIVVTGSLGDEVAVEYIKAGAADYVLKHHLERLPAAVGQVVREKAHREAEKRLHEQILAGKREWELTFDSVAGPIFLLDADCRIRRANAAASEALDMSFQQIIGRLCFEILPGAGKVSVECPHGKSFELAHPGRQKSGRVFDANCKPLRDSSGQISGFVFAMHDITRRKQAEDEIRKLSRAVEQSPASVLITSPDGRIEYVNPSFSLVTGYSSEEVRGGNPRMLKSGETPAEEYQKLWQTITSGREWQGVLHNRRKDGTLYWVRASISPIRNDDGTIAYFVAVEEDISSQRLLEEQLRQAQRMEAVGRLAGGVAHDFNNLLTIINGHAQLMIEDSGPGRPPDSHLIEILKAGERAAALTGRLLTFSRKQVVAVRPLDLNAVIKGIESMLHRLIGEDVELIIDGASRLGQVMADPGQVEQVIMNLAVNARDAMPGGGRLILETADATLDEAYARSHLDVRPGRYVMMAATDTGCGMDAEVLGHIFEPFFTTKEAGKGTGLGLATVYGIMKQAGGHIGVYSEVGRGTTFRVYWPRLDESVEEAEEKQVWAGTLTGTESILVVEDEPGVRSLIQATLEPRGYQVLAAAQPEEAEAIVRRHPGPLHLVLTDVIMPGRNGKTLAADLARLRPGLRVLYMSGYTADAMGREGVLDSGVIFLPKPFTSLDLLRKVREALGDPT